eukprot:CAMPEP_0202690552 /NCGR_PEP_ID=MMETSP1385-20130828/5502_1 /ASSEMBLY_ACC=CAM_ASM_000861 /TAXON_ID=933848 /ORGANISM="Elphidium margaritaceum" /LENGTH=179 /DNA_ID=CAMNT_0049345823 /DNA_START=97 /DNA_END=636 /DNA_ORIENTATION=+
MNPNATDYVPSASKMEMETLAQQRSSHLWLLAQQIKLIKARLFTDNIMLVASYKHLKIKHCQLSHEVECKKDHTGSVGQKPIDVMVEEFQRLADEYNAKNAAFINLASELIRIQKLRDELIRIRLLKPVRSRAGNPLQTINTNVPLLSRSVSSLSPIMEDAKTCDGRDYGWQQAFLDNE